MSFGKFFGDIKKKANEFLDKPETKEAISKLKEEFGEVKTKVDKLVEEGDTILKDKVDGFLNKNKEGQVVDGEVVEPKEEVVEPKEEVVESKEEVVESKEEVVQPKEEVVQPKEEVVQPKEEVVQPKEEVVEPKEEVVEPKEEVVEPKEEVVEPKEEVVSIDSLGLAAKLTNTLKDNNIDTVQELKSMSDDEILSIKGVGAAALKKIREALK